MAGIKAGKKSVSPASTSFLISPNAFWWIPAYPLVCFHIASNTKQVILLFFFFNSPLNPDFLSKEKSFFPHYFWPKQLEIWGWQILRGIHIITTPGTIALFIDIPTPIVCYLNLTCCSRNVVSHYEKENRRRSKKRKCSFVFVYSCVFDNMNMFCMIFSSH